MASCLRSDMEIIYGAGRKVRLSSERRKGERESESGAYVVNLLDTEPVKDVGHEDLETHIWSRVRG
jgi:hypothetical protein